MNKTQFERELAKLAKPGPIVDTHDSLQAKMSPAHRAISKQIDEQMADDENVNFLLYICDEYKLTREEVEKLINAVKPGSYFVEDLSGKQAFVRAADGTIQEVSAYLNRLEKVTIQVMSDLSAVQKQLATEKTTNEGLKHDMEVYAEALAAYSHEFTAFQLITQGFRKLFTGRRGEVERVGHPISHS